MLPISTYGNPSLPQRLRSGQQPTSNNARCSACLESQFLSPHPTATKTIMGHHSKTAQRMARCGVNQLRLAATILLFCGEYLILLFVPMPCKQSRKSVSGQAWHLAMSKCKRSTRYDSFLPPPLNFNLNGVFLPHRPIPSFHSFPYLPHLEPAAIQACHVQPALVFARRKSVMTLSQIYTDRALQTFSTLPFEALHNQSRPYNALLPLVIGQHRVSHRLHQLFLVT
jgi:hypothetical protein